VVTLLAYAMHRLGRHTGGAALQGDGALNGIGAPSGEGHA
jgi:hypothetical protein